LKEIDRLLRVESTSSIRRQQRLQSVCCGLERADPEGRWWPN